MPKVYGLLITKDDHEVFADWCLAQLRQYAAVVCLDGSTSSETAHIAAQFADRLVYLHERDFDISHKTDHGLRRVVHQEIIRRFGTGVWVMCCHADEFCYHDPRKVAERAQREGYDQVSWFTPHFFPHPDDLSDWPLRRRLPVPERFRYYHWSYRGSAQPWLEDRLYFAGTGVDWDEHTHGNVRPHGLKRSAPFHAILSHYKVIVTDPSWYEQQETCAPYRQHWPGLEHRTGLSYPIRRFEDLFVKSVRDYARCDRFDGVFKHAWNMGEDYRPDIAGSNRQSPSPIGVVTATNHTLRMRDQLVHVPIFTRGAVDMSILRDLWDKDVYGVRRIDKPPKCIVDIGAHIGIFARMVAEIWPSARVICCEADPENVALLRRNLHGQSNAEIVEAAITDNDAAEVTFYAVPDKIGSNSGGGSINRPESDSVPIRVPALSAQRLWETKCIRRCDLLKLDCEGAEVPILRGLAEAGALPRVGRIVGEWHALDRRSESRGRLKRELESLLRDTHEVTFTADLPGREGHFIACLRRE